MENGVKRFFYDDFNLRLRVIPHKKKDKIEVLKEVSAQFEENQFYSEREVNHVLETIYDDFPLLRRNLIDFNFLCRDRNGYAYWKNNYHEKFCIPTEEEIYKFIINNFAENTVRFKLPIDSLKKISNLEDPIFIHLLNLGFIVLKDGSEK